MLRFGLKDFFANITTTLYSFYKNKTHVAKKNKPFPLTTENPLNMILWSIPPPNTRIRYSRSGQAKTPENRAKWPNMDVYR